MDPENYSGTEDCPSQIIHFFGTPKPDDGETTEDEDEVKTPGTPPEVSPPGTPKPDDGETTEDEDEVKTPDTPPEVSPPGSPKPDDGETTEDEVKTPDTPPGTDEEVKSPGTPKVVSPKLSPVYASPSDSSQETFEEFVKTKWNTSGAKMYGRGGTLPPIFIVKYLVFLLLMYKEEGTEEEVYLTSANVGKMSQEIFLQGSDDTKKVKSAFQDMLKRLSNSNTKFFEKQKLLDRGTAVKAFNLSRKEKEEFIKGFFESTFPFDENFNKLVPPLKRKRKRESTE